MLTCLLLLALFSSVSATCEPGYYYNSGLDVCLVCPTNCLSCCDENICSQCDTG